MWYNRSMNKGPKAKPLIERFESHVNKTDTCWLWQGHITPKGYGYLPMKHNDGVWRPTLAHRIAYQIYKGDIPEGMTIDHLCRTRNCVNPAHLEAVTQSVNLHRGDTLQAQNSAKTHCPKGHPYDEQNTWISRFGKRSCRVCNRERATLRRARLS